METALETTVEELPVKTGDASKKKSISFAEQYLEKPVYRGDDIKEYEMARFTATACTLRGVPIWDDF